VTLDDSDLDAQLVSEYRAARERMSEIVSTLDTAAAQRRVPACPA
jgi:hypothetical protein